MLLELNLSKKMATTITSATLTVTLTESISLNGSDQGATNTLTIASVNEVSKRIITVEDAANGTEVYKGGAAAGAGQFISANVKYIRLTNLDDTNFVVLHLEGSSHYSQHKLEAGKSFILPTPVGFDNNADIDNYSAETITTIQAKADSADVDLELFVACT